MRVQNESGFSLDCDTSIPGLATVRMAGSLDAHSYEVAEEQFDDLISSGNSRIVVDVGGLDYISSAGIGVLIGALARTRKDQGNLLLVNATKTVREILAVLGLDSMFFIAPDRVTALAFLNR
jgi:anti-sigma B factor antagonist